MGTGAKLAESVRGISFGIAGDRVAHQKKKKFTLNIYRPGLKGELSPASPPGRARVRPSTPARVPIPAPAPAPVLNRIPSARHSLGYRFLFWGASLPEACGRCNDSRVRYSTSILRDGLRALKGSNRRACLSCGHKWHLVDPDDYPGRRKGFSTLRRVSLVAVLSILAGIAVAS